MADVQKGHAIGPFEEEEVATSVGSDKWICAYRFPVEQKNKIRGVDDASDNLIHATSTRPEKLQISSVDRIMALVRAWSSSCPKAPLVCMHSFRF